MDAICPSSIVPSGLVFKLCFCPGMRERSKTSVASLPICASLTGLRELFGWSGFSGGARDILMHILVRGHDALWLFRVPDAARLAPPDPPGRRPPDQSV